MSCPSLPSHQAVIGPSSARGAAWIPVQALRLRRDDRHPDTIPTRVDDLADMGLPRTNCCVRCISKSDLPKHRSDSTVPQLAEQLQASYNDAQRPKRTAVPAALASCRQPRATPSLFKKTAAEQAASLAQQF